MSPIFKKTPSSTKPGFTLIEVLIVIGVLAIIGSIALGAFSRFRGGSQIDAAVRSVLGTLRSAQSKTLASESDTAYGVHFQADRIVLFRGPTYEPSAVTNEAVIFQAPIQLTTVSLTGGATDVLFGRITGTTSVSGTLTLSDGTRSRTITLELSGQARAEAAALSAGNTRITDTRHVNFLLGWSVQNAIALKLTFSNPPNPDTVQSIGMSPYFNADKSSFDWSGTVNVNGDNQTLRIHTVSLDAANTHLSIHRDRGLNNKAVAISITDGGFDKGVASYTAAGTSTAGIYGGTMTIQ